MGVEGDGLQRLDLRGVAPVAGDPDRFRLPRTSDLRFNWVVVRLATIDVDEMRELVLDAWRMVVPKKVIAPYEATIAD